MSTPDSTTLKHGGSISPMKGPLYDKRSSCQSKRNQIPCSCRMTAVSEHFLH